MSGAISDTLRVLIGDDHRIVREGLKQVLADAPDVQVVAEAQTGLEVLQQVADLQGREGLDLVLLDPPFRGGTLEKILPAVEKCVAPGGIVLCESETGIVLPAEAGGLTLKKQYKYGRVLLWKYTKPMQNTDPAENEPKGEAL